MRRAALGLVAFWLLLAPASAEAQAISSGPSPVTGETLLDRTAVARGRQLIYGATEEERRRGVERLASSGTPQAVDALLEALETGSVIARDPAARLLAVRLLSAQAGREDVRKLLVRELHEGGGRRDPALRVATLLRETAALALARAGDDESLKVLVAASAQRGPAGEAARAALTVAPPVAISSILYEPPPDDTDEPEADAAADPDPFPAEERGGPRPRKPKPKPERVTTRETRDKHVPTGPRSPRALLPPLLSLLGDLGDVRAIPVLRNELGSPHRPSRAAAAVALAKLGDASAGDGVVGWIDDAEPRLVAAAAETLVMTGHPKAARAVAKALKDDTTRSAAIELAHDLASAELRAPLVELLPKLEGKDAVRAVMALGRAGAVADLAKFVEDDRLGPAAITALGTTPAAEATDSIAKRLADPRPQTRRAFVRAATIRALVLGDAPAGLEEALLRMSASKDGSDREAAAFGRVALGLETAEAVLGKGADLPVVAGAARGAALRGQEELEAFAPLVVGMDPEAPRPVAVAAGIALLSRDVSDAVPFKTLLRLSENGGALAALAARALPRRDDGTAQGRVRALLEGTDPSVRASIALGFGEAKEPSSVSVLARRYHVEEDERVRRAIVLGLSMRSEPQRTKVLEVAARVDPDPEVRRIARQALSGRRVKVPAPLELGTASLLRVEGSDPSQPPLLRLVLPSALAIPVVPAPDGALLIGGMPFGPASIELPEADPMAKAEEPR